MNMEYSCVLLLSAVCVWLAALNGCLANGERFKESPFPNKTLLFNRMVTCANPVNSDMVYEAKTWSCRDMRIDGHRLRYWYRVPDHSCTDADETFDAGADARDNDLAGLCRGLLKANNENGQLRAAFIHDPSCANSGIQRIRLGRNITLTDGFEWHLHKAGHGFMKTLRCMLLES